MRRFLYTEKNCSFSDLLNFLFAFFVFSLNKIKQILYHCFCKAFSKNLPRNVLLLFLFSHLFFTEVNTPKPDNTSQYNVLNSTGFQDHFTQIICIMVQIIVHLVSFMHPTPDLALKFPKKSISWMVIINKKKQKPIYSHNQKKY